MSRVWVIDDETAIRELLYESLSRRGYQVTTVGSGTQALDMYKSLRPELIVVDSSMPGLSGIETARQIRAFDESVPIVLLKGVDEQEVTAEEAKRTGIGEIVPKNANAEQFVGSVDLALKRLAGRRIEDGEPVVRVPGALLIVDDDAQILRLMMSFFTSRGLRVLLATSGEEALKATSEHLRAVLLDVNMPGMDGLMTLRKLKAACPALPVIMISGVGEEATVQEAMEAGAYDYVTKPFSLDYLETVVLTKILLGADG